MTFDVLKNPLTQERAVIRQHADASNGYTTVIDGYASPGASPAGGTHIHPHAVETFTVVRGLLTVKMGDVVSEAGPGDRVSIPAGVTHDWWNAGDQPSYAILEVEGSPRFEEMIRHLFFFAADGKTDAKGRPHLLQSALFALEFDDTSRFATPPRAVQKLLFGALAPLARLRGYRATYPEYAKRVSEVVDALEELPPEIAAQLPYGIPGSTAAPR